MELGFLDHNEESANFKLNLLLNLFPHGDFKYLQNKCIELAADESAFEAFVDHALSTNSVPSSRQNEEDIPNYQEQEDSIAVKEICNVETFVEKYPDPFGYFDTIHRTDTHKTQMVEFLKDRFRDVKSSFIEHIVIKEKYNLVRSAAHLGDVPLHAIRLQSRSDIDINVSLPWDQNLRKEVFLLDNQDEIRAYLQIQEEIRKTAVEEGQVFECECCWSDDVLPSEVIMCTEAHIFCKICIKKSTEVRIGDGHITFPCLTNCTEGVIPLDSIKTVLDPKIYEKIAARIQEEDVKSADIPGMEFCQRCEYGAILDENIIIFKCEKCNFELCRKCNKESHVPRKCGETVQDDIRKQERKKNEEFQTTQVLRRCGGCKKPYVKISGCDFITCTCGVGNCYKCGASRITHSHSDACNGVFNPTL